MRCVTDIRQILFSRIDEIKEKFGVERLGRIVWCMEIGAKRRRKIVRRVNGKVVEFEEVRYGLLMMVLCDREGRVYDVWISFGSVHEVRAFRERKKRSLWFRGLVENCVVYELSESLNIHAPISLAVYKIVVEGFPAGEVALELLKRPPQTPFEIL